MCCFNGADFCMTQTRQEKAIHASFSNRVPFNKENVAKVPDATGQYQLFDKNGKLIYVGVSHDGKFSGLRHRLQSYYQVDDFKEHPTKKWRGRIKTFSYKSGGLKQSQRSEARIKQRASFNADNKAHDLHRRKK